jgi:caffeoyl-CoA O-methyltransferase
MADSTGAPKSFLLTADLASYLVSHGSPPDARQLALIDETAALGPIAGMQVAPEQGAFLTLLTRLIGARSAVEVGTFTGYSALCIARGLPADGHLLCCDVSEEYTAVARRYWERAGVADRVELRLAPAVETLRALPSGRQLDFAFIDADKSGYDGYYERCLVLLRPGGLIAIDNVLWGGNVARPSGDADTMALQALNTKIHRDERVDIAMLPLGDGVTLARKR